MPWKVLPTTSWNNDTMIRIRKSQTAHKHRRNTPMQRLRKQGWRSTTRFHKAHGSETWELAVGNFSICKKSCFSPFRTKWL